MSTVIIITPPPKSPYLNDAQYAQQMQERWDRLQRDMNALREAGFTVSVKGPEDADIDS